MRTLQRPTKTLKRPRVFPKYDTDHKVGMQVPKGGSSCSTCHYLSSDGLSCKEDKWYKWNFNDPKLPYSNNQYCCDFWKPKERSLLK